jgi:hypothetical protein
MLTGFSVTENYGSDAGLFYSTDDKNQTMNAYMVLRYEFLYSQNSLEDAPAKLTEHNVSVTHEIKHFAHHDAALIGMMNMTRDALRSMPEGKTLPIAFAYADSFADKGMRELSEGYILGDDYDVNLTDEPEITTKIIKMHWYNTTTDERLEPVGIIEEVETWGLDDDEKATTTLLLLAWALGEISMPVIGSHEAEFYTPEKEDIFKKIEKGVDITNLIEVISVGILFCLLKPFISMMIGYALSVSLALATCPREVALTIRTFGNQPRSFQFMKGISLFLARNTGLGAAGEEVAGRVACRIMKAVKWIGRALIVIAVVAIIAQFLYIAYKEGWTGFGFAVAGMYTIMTITYIGILYAISCIPYVGWIIALVIIAADLIATFGFHRGSGWLMEKLVSKLIDFKLRSNIELSQGDTTVNIEDYDDNGLTVGDRLEIKSWFWAKTWETKRGKEHGDHADYKKSYIHPKYEYTKDDSTFDSGSYDHYCDLGGWTKIDHDLNAGAGGDYIYLCVKEQPQSD